MNMISRRSILKVIPLPLLGGGLFSSKLFANEKPELLKCGLVKFDEKFVKESKFRVEEHLREFFSSKEMEVVQSIDYKYEDLFTIIKIDFSTLKSGDYYVLEDKPLTIMRCLSDYNPGPNNYGHCGWVSCEEVQLEFRSPQHATVSS